MASSSYAAGTSVPVERSRAEIEKILKRYGASSFIFGFEHGSAIVGFRMHDRSVRFLITLPSGGSYSSRERHDQEIRRRWRVLALVLKAKLEAVASKVSEFETEFLGNIVVGNGQTVAEWARPQLDSMYRAGRVPALLPGAAPP